MSLFDVLSFIYAALAAVLVAAQLREKDALRSSTLYIAMLTCIVLSALYGARGEIREIRDTVRETHPTAAL